MMNIYTYYGRAVGIDDSCPICRLRGCKNRTAPFPGRMS